MSAKLARDSLLVVPSQLNLEIRHGRMLVETECGTRSYGLETLGVLHAFREPRSMAEGVAALREAFSNDFMALSSRIIELVQLGILVSPSTGRFVGDDGSFDGAAVHLAMLDDAVRTTSFVDAIRANVRPDDIVLDIGTGTGILAVAAARAGARHVYALDRGAVAEVAERVVRANGVADRCTVLRTMSTDAVLPERATLLVSEIVGNDPFGEGIIRTYADANARLLAPNARRIPRRLAVYAHLVEVPADIRAEHFADEERVAWWSQRYGVDLDAVRQAAPREPVVVYLSSTRARTLMAASSATQLGMMDLAHVTPTMACTQSIRTERACRVGGIAITFSLELDDRHHISSDVSLNAQSHWRTPLWLLPEPMSVEAGDAVTVAWRTSPTGSRLGLVT